MPPAVPLSDWTDFDSSPPTWERLKEGYIVFFLCLAVILSLSGLSYCGFQLLRTWQCRKQDPPPAEPAMATPLPYSALPSPTPSLPNRPQQRNVQMSAETPLSSPGYNDGEAQTNEQETSQDTLIHREEVGTCQNSPRSFESRSWISRRDASRLPRRQVPVPQKHGKSVDTLSSTPRINQPNLDHDFSYSSSPSPSPLPVTQRSSHNQDSSQTLTSVGAGDIGRAVPMPSPAYFTSYSPTAPPLGQDAELAENMSKSETEDEKEKKRISIPMKGSRMMWSGESSGFLHLPIAVRPLTEDQTKKGMEPNFF